MRLLLEVPFEKRNQMICKEIAMIAGVYILHQFRKYNS